MPLWHKGYLELIILRNIKQRKYFGNDIVFPSFSNNLNTLRKSPIVRMAPPCSRKIMVMKSQKTPICVESNWKPCNKLIYLLGYNPCLPLKIHEHRSPVQTVWSFWKLVESLTGKCYWKLSGQMSILLKGKLEPTTSSLCSTNLNTRWNGFLLSWSSGRINWLIKGPQ